MEDRSRSGSWGLQIIRHPVISTLVALFFTLVILVFLGGYLFHWDWTGINSQENKITTISTPQGTYRATEVQSEKTLWDWLQLLAVLAIPVVVGIGAAWFTTQQGKVSDRENKDNQREAALQAYIDKMSELLLHEKLRGSKPEDDVRRIARARTLTMLRGLDSRRKKSLVQFLYESELIIKDEGKSIVDLSLADLRETSLHWADLAGADLRNVGLSGADLRRTNLFKADLSGSNLSGADLSKANLSEAALSGTNLREVRFLNANLSGANLAGAELQGAVVTPEQLDKAKSLKGATMPDRSLYP